MGARISCQEMKYLTKWGFKENVPQESGTMNTVSKKSKRGFSG